MRSHVAPARNDPPSMWDRGTAHPVETVIAAYGLFEAVKVSILAHAGGIAHPSLSVLPLQLVIVLILFIGTGSAVALKGLLVHREDLRKELNAEQVGWALLGIGWVAYSVSADVLNPSLSVSADLGYFIALAAGWRYYGLRRVERTLDHVKEVIESTGAAPPIIPEESAT